MLLRASLVAAVKQGSALLRCASQEAALCLVAASSRSAPALFHSAASRSQSWHFPASKSGPHTSLGIEIRHEAPTRGVASSAREVVTFPLAQTGEGISECELMQWFVKVIVPTTVAHGEGALCSTRANLT